MTPSSLQPAERQVREAGPHLRIETVSTFDDLLPLQQEWDECVERTGSDIYFTLDWLRTWWKYYGHGRYLRCYLVRQGDQLVAVLPFCIQRFGLGPIGVKVARFVGADSTIPVLSPPIEPGCERQVLGLALTELFGAETCNTVSLSPLSGASPLVTVAERLCADDNFCRLAQSKNTGPHTLFRLPENFEDYLMALQKRQRSNYRRDLKQLSKEFEVTERVISGREAAGFFSDFAKLHAAQWNAAGRPGHFGDWPDSETFNRELVEKFSAGGKARFYQIIGSGKLLSAQFCFVLGDKCYWRLPARDPDPEFRKLGLGRLGLIRMLEALIRDGISLVEAGPGHYEYKLKHGGEELPLHHIVLARADWISRWKTMLLLLWAGILHFLYYRLWVLKIMPRLGIRGGQLWHVWIRSRL